MLIGILLHLCWKSLLEGKVLIVNWSKKSKRCDARLWKAVAAQKRCLHTSSKTVWRWVEHLDTAPESGSIRHLASLRVSGRCRCRMATIFHKAAKILISMSFVYFQMLFQMLFKCLAWTVTANVRFNILELLECENFKIQPIEKCLWFCVRCRRKAA